MLRVIQNLNRKVCSQFFQSTTNRYYLSTIAGSQPPHLYKTKQSQETISNDTASRMARSRGQNHGIAHMKRRQLKDRYSIHKLTNLAFLKHLVMNDSRDQYELRTNQLIVLLAQIDHLIRLLGSKYQYHIQYGVLLYRILDQLKNPTDLPWNSLGTLMMTLSQSESFGQKCWLELSDKVSIRNYDEDYDQLFGMIKGYNLYKRYAKMKFDYYTLTGDLTLPFIAIFYRNSLRVLIDFIRHGIYQQRQVKTICRCFWQENINEYYFWETVRDWFNLQIKENLNKKEMEDFFIMQENAIEVSLYDNGMIRPRPILQQITQIAFILSENAIISKRFLVFFQDLILFAMQNGSRLYEVYTKRQYLHRQKKQSDRSYLNEHMQYKNKQQQQRAKNMQKDYELIFINPIDLKNESLIQLFVVISRSAKASKQVQLYRTSKKINKIFKQKQQADPLQTENHQQTNEKAKQNDFADKFSGLDEQFHYTPNTYILKWLWQRINRSEMSYTVKQLLLVVNEAKQLNFSEEIVERFVLEKLKNLRQMFCSIEQLRNLMLYLNVLNFNKLMGILQAFLQKQHPSNILKLTKLIEEKSWIPYLQEYFIQLPKIVNFHERYYSFEQNCYFLYLLRKNQGYWEYKANNQYHGQMEILKEQIKTTAFSRGFKLKMDSYFVKMLEYIDVIEFFEGGQ